MKNVYLIALAAIVLGACWGAPPNEKILTLQCFDLFAGDARTVGMVANDARTDLDTFCACYGAKVAGTPELIDLHKDILVAMNAAKGEGGAKQGTQGQRRQGGKEAKKRSVVPRSSGLRDGQAPSVALLRGRHSETPGPLFDNERRVRHSM